MRRQAICTWGILLAAVLPGRGHAQQNKNNNFVFAQVPGGANGNVNANGLPAVWVAGSASRFSSPATQTMSQIRAYNRLARQYGNNTSSNPFLVQQQIANSVAYVRAYYEKKAIYESEKAKRHVAPLDEQKIANSKTWGWLKDHPEMTGTSIIDGKAQNFLLHRLAGTMLALKFSPGDQPVDAAMLQQLKLAPELVHQLKLRQDLPNGERLEFRADEGTALSSDWWPFALRGDEFATRRAAFDKARRAAVDESQKGQISNKALNDLMSALNDIDAEFQRRFDKTTRVKTPLNFQRFLTAQRYIQSQAAQIARMQSTGDASAFDGSLKFQANDLVALLTYMSRHGLEFAPAKPGEEAAYHNLFHMMRDLYVTIADNDESIQIPQHDDDDKAKNGVNRRFPGK
jgi:hypothetical protein